MSQKDQRRVFVAQAEGQWVPEIDILKLLSTAEIDLGAVKFVGDAGDLDDLTSSDAIVMILRDDAGESALLDAAAFAGAREGVCNIVGVWAPGQAQTGIHPAAAKYSTAQVPWEADKVKSELGSDCANAFLTPEGEDADPNEVEPNECD
ncbi:hypothetical protein [Hyphomonas atlantica]|uniref:hypothetical protein n=1 Tax=Hyphomonas atlantica TaxID=1280948 RepID=UPI0023F3B1B5|nr:hypothetical protein [Hyphomonas atlantica]